MSKNNWTLFYLIKALSDDTNVTSLVTKQNKSTLLDLKLLLNTYNKRAKDNKITSNDVEASFSKHTTKSSLRLHLPNTIDLNILNECIDDTEVKINVNENKENIILY